MKKWIAEKKPNTSVTPNKTFLRRKFQVFTHYHHDPKQKSWNSLKKSHTSEPSYIFKYLKFYVKILISILWIFDLKITFWIFAQKIIVWMFAPKTTFWNFRPKIKFGFSCQNHILNFSAKNHIFQFSWPVLWIFVPQNHILNFPAIFLCLLNFREKIIFLSFVTKILIFTWNWNESFFFVVFKFCGTAEW